MIAFIHIEKTAGITLNHILRQSFGTRHLDILPLDPRSHYVTLKDLRLANSAFRNLVSIAGHAVRPTDELREYFPDLKYYSFFRDPMARTASHYQYQVQHMGVKEPFESWICRDEYRNFQVQKLVGSEDLVRALRVLENDIEIVGLTHRFDESLAIIKKQFALLNIRTSYEARNVAKSNVIKNRLLKNPLSRRYLEDANELDKILLEHATNRFESQVRSYQGDLVHDVAISKSFKPGFGDIFHYASNVFFRNIYYKPVVNVVRAVR